MKRLLEARMRDRDRMRSWTWRTQRDRADASLTPAHTDSHGDYMPETVPPGVLSNFVSPHMQEEDSHPQRKQQRPLITGLQSHAGSIARGHYALSGMGTPYTRSQAWMEREPSPRGSVTHGDRVSSTGGISTRAEIHEEIMLSQTWYSLSYKDTACKGQSPR